VDALEAVTDEDVPASFAVLGVGVRAGDEKVLVGFAPRHGGDAALATLAMAGRMAAEEDFSGEALAVAPQWSIAARRRLALLGDVPFRFRPLSASSLLDNGGAVEAEPAEPVPPLPAASVADALASADARELFRRALGAVEGLAAKHGGAVRGVEGGAELVLLARRVAVLRADGGPVSLETLQPERSHATLTSDGLPGALDRLEGQLRKHLNDRRVKASDESARAQALPGLTEAVGLRAALRWPLGGSDPEVLDLAGIDPEGRPVVAAVRRRLGLPDLAALLDALIQVRPALPLLFARSGAPLRLGAAPRLVIAAESFDPAVSRVLATLTLDHALYEVRPRRAGAPEVVLQGEASGAPAAAVAQEARPPRSRRRRGGRSPAREGDAEPAGRDRDAGPVESRPAEASGGRQGESESAGGRPAEGGGRRRSRRPAREDRPPAGGTEERAAGGAVEEISLFDLDDDARPSAGGEDAEAVGRSRRRRRGRRRGRRGADGDEEAEADRGAAPEDRAGELLDVDVEDDLSATLAPLDEVPDEEAALEGYEEEEVEAGEAPEDDWAREREMRRRARLAKISPEPEPEEPERPHRRRAAIVAHSDRDSVAAAVLLARDIRVVEGFWVYPQSELMTFFRSVATDLRSDTPIFVVGFTARPARDVIQAAALYSGRLGWYDHQDWPPEDMEALRATIGAPNVNVEPGSGSSLPAVMAHRTRRSRFSDKLVELVTGRFTQHDYERWGRIWWHRLGEVANQPGDRRSAIDALLSGRPSDLAKEAAAAECPPLPPEVGFVSERDFRVVHFGGYALVVVPVPEGLDVHLTARAVRERLGVQVSVAYREGSELIVLGAEEARGRRSLDLGAMVSHLASKHDWIDAMRDEDHVARLRARGIVEHPERLDEVVAAVAMGRSILEG
jgi:hypothetical protein